MELNYLHQDGSPRIAIIDNYDSFTFNLVQLLAALGATVSVFPNDVAQPGDVVVGQQAIVVAPGPGGPRDAGVSLEVVSTFAGVVPMLGVCLGHQVMAHRFGARVTRASRPLHGKTERVYHDGIGVYTGMPLPFEAARYNSLSVVRASLPDSIEVTAWSEESEVLGFRHRALALEAFQFHPESILSEDGARLLGNWLSTLATTPQAISGSTSRKERWQSG